MNIKNVKDLNKIKKETLAISKKHPKKVLVCCGTGCIANGATKIVESVRDGLAKRKLKDVSIEILKETGCHGFCELGPLVIIEPQEIFYTKVKPKHVDDILDKSFLENEIIEPLLFTNPVDGSKITKYNDISFFKHQQRIALRNLGKISAHDMKEYIGVDGYQALAKVLFKMTPDEVIEEVIKSGLRGRGGGGFSAGKKWKICKNIQADKHYVICNGDEGDPGAFMDRSIMEGDPHGVLEGMMIAAYAIGAKEGYIYVRDEYPLAVTHLEKAILDCERSGLLGENILGTDFSFTIKIARGAGAFVCGESSALMKSVAGEVGEPRAKYVRSVVKGLYDEPTVLNNVETLVNIPTIIRKGADWYSSIGTKKSTGTKVFSLVGKVRNTGLIEVPMGITLREIIYDIGGGILEDRPFKAVQTGGPSGGCIPESMLDLPVDFDSLTEVGSMMGSGGMIVMDDKTCIVDVAKYFLEFLVEESCGKCTPCREGLYQLHKLLEKICAGKGEMSDIEKMERLSENVMIGSLCGLGKSGPNPLMSTLKHFKDEYIEHIKDKKCRAGVCPELITYEILDNCTGCMACIPACGYDAITGKKKEVHIIAQDKCTKCGACYAVCNFDSILVS